MLQVPLAREDQIKLEQLLDALAEDTFTTFKTQLAGNRVVFEPHAVVWAEEPDSIVGLWKQRLRWARGNVQVTKQFKHVWCRPSTVHRLGSVSFSLSRELITASPRTVADGSRAGLGEAVWIQAAP